MVSARLAFSPLPAACPPLTLLLQELLLVHRFLPYEMLLMWDALNQPNLTCGRQSQVY